MTSPPFSQPFQTPRPRQAIPRRVAIVTIATVLASVAAEFGHRAWRSWHGKSYDSGAVTARIEAMLDPIRRFVPGGHEEDRPLSNGLPLPILHSYYGAETEHDTGGVLRYFRENPDSRDYEVVVVGGSFGACFAETQAAPLAETIESDPRMAGRKVRVLNFCHASYKQPQQLHRVTFLLTLGARPEAVVNIDGFNEVALAMENAYDNTHPIYPNAPTWAASAASYGSSNGIPLEVVVQLLALRDEARRAIERTLRFGFARSSILDTWTLGRLRDINRRRHELERTITDEASNVNPRKRRQLQGPDFPASEALRMRMCVDAWAEASISLHAVCRARGIEYMHVLQPTLGDEGSKPRSTKEASIVPPSADWSDGPRAGYPLLRERSRELIARGLHFLDASRVFETVDREIYIDQCHFGPAGNELLGARIGPAFRQLLGDE